MAVSAVKAVKAVPVAAILHGAMEPVTVEEVAQAAPAVTVVQVELRLKVVLMI